MTAEGFLLPWEPVLCHSGPPEEQLEGAPHTPGASLTARDLDSNAAAYAELRPTGLIHILLEDRYLHQKLPWNLILHNVAQTNDTPETLCQGQQ